MRMPAKPPNYLDLITKSGGPWVAEALSAGRATSEYLHWDKLRHLCPPEGLTNSQWWAGVKLSRNCIDLPLIDSQGRPFQYSMPGIVLEALNAVAVASAGRLGLSERVHSDVQRNRYRMSSLREEAVSSSQLEGAATTRAIAKEMLRTGRRPATLGEQMISNNFAAMQWIGQRQHEAITPEAVLDLHRIVCHNTMPDEEVGRLQHPGEPRVGVYSPTNVELHRPPDAVELPDRLNRLCAFASGAISPDEWLHPIARAIITHFMVGYDHYFSNGNGRTARAMFYWVALREGHWLMEYIALSRVIQRAPAQYGRAYLLSETDAGDLTYFLIHQLDALTRSLEDLADYLERKQQQVGGALATVRGLGLNHRQLAVISAITQDSSLAITAKSHANSHAVTVQTARADLSALARLGFLESAKRGRQAIWIASSEVNVEV